MGQPSVRMAVNVSAKDLVSLGGADGGAQNPGRCMTPENLLGKIRQAHKKIDPYQMTALQTIQFTWDTFAQPLKPATQHSDCNATSQ